NHGLRLSVRALPLAPSMPAPCPLQTLRPLAAACGVLRAKSVARSSLLRVDAARLLGAARARAALPIATSSDPLRKREGEAQRAAAIGRCLACASRAKCRPIKCSARSTTSMPTPESSPLSTYLEHLERGELAYQFSVDAGRPVFFPRVLCPFTGST